MVNDDLNVQRTQYTQSGTIGGSEFVWLKGCYTQRVVNGATILNYPNAGGYVPSASLAQFVMKGHGNDTQNICNIAYAFKVQAVAGATDTDVKIEKNKYAFIPQVGMIVGKCPSALDATVTGVTITNVVEGNVFYTVTLSATLGALTTDDFLVEVTEAGAAKSLVITHPNTFIGEEMYFGMAGISGITMGDDPYSTPLYVHNTAYTSRMPKYPNIFLSGLNKSKIEGLIEI